MALAEVLTEGRWRRFPHLAYLGEKLTASIKRGKARIIVMLPPQFGKSTLISHFLPTWYIGTYPERRVILASYETSYAETWGRRVRDTLEEHGSKIFGVHVRQDSSAAGRWDLHGHEGGMSATGVGGPITGKKADCFPAGTMIATSSGYIDIATLHRLKYPPQVLSYNHAEKRYEFVGIQASRCWPSRTRIMEIKTVRGRCIALTEDHRLFTIQHGYRNAAALNRGVKLGAMYPMWESEMASREKARTYNTQKVSPSIMSEMLFQEKVYRHKTELLSVRKGIYEKGLSDCEIHWSPSLQRLLLLSEMCHGSRQDKTQSKMSMRELREWQRSHVLLSRLYSKENDATGKAVPSLLPDVSADFLTSNILLKEMRGCDSFDKNDWFGQFTFQDRNILRKDFPPDEASHPEEGRIQVRRLWMHRKDLYNQELEIPQWFSNEVKSYHPSHRREHRKQHPAEFDFCLSDASCDSSQIQEDSVSVVRLLREAGEPVYDLRVDKNHNFFANDLLVHNCLIVDDPVKDDEEAQSEIDRQKKYDWYLTVALTRLSERGSIVIVMTRWHESDLVGQLLRDMKQGVGEAFEVIRLPAIAEENENWGDGLFTRQIGEPLCPQLFSLETLKARQAALGDHKWARLYQQRPYSSIGGMFNVQKLRERTLAVSDAPRLTVRAWDLAATEKKDSKRTAGVRLSKTHEGRYVIEHVVLGKWTPDKRNEIMHHTAIGEPEIKILFEHEGGSSGEDQALSIIRMMQGFRIEAIRVTGSKQLRADPVAAQINAGNVWIVDDGTWDVEAFLSELSSFPHGTYMDQCDATSLAYNFICTKLVTSSELPIIGAPDRPIRREDLPPPDEPENPWDAVRVRDPYRRHDPAG